MFQRCHLSQHQLGLKTLVGGVLEFDTSLAPTIMRYSGRGRVALLLISMTDFEKHQELCYMFPQIFHCEFKSVSVSKNLLWITFF